MKSNDRDPFTMIAIKFVLGIVLGFSLILMGFIFFIIAILSQTSENYQSVAWKWYLSTLVSEVVGVGLFYKTLKGSPEPGQISTSGKIKPKRDWI